MQLDDVKVLIDTYFRAGHPEVVTADCIEKLNLDGCHEDALDYLHETYLALSAGYAKNLTDTGNAERLVRMYGDNLHYCYDRKRWLIFNGASWDWDDGNESMELAKQVARSIYAEAGKEDDKKARNEIISHAKASESDARRKAMLECAQSENGIPVPIEDLDANRWLLNCFNGTVDLRTGEVKSHDRRDLQTILLPTAYNKQAQCPLWMNFLNTVTGGKPELMAYLQRAVGYSLTGDNREQCLFFLYGLGRNGKSTFLAIIRRMLGAYALKTSTDLFMAKDRTGGPSEGLADLQGKRFVVASEIEEGRRLATVLVKDMTGGEAIRADRKYEHAFEFEPTHKIWLSGNHKPTITDTTFSIWRRFKLIPFTVTIPEEQQDPHLFVKLLTEMEGILAWAVQGCLDWQEKGLGEPDTVKKATEAYRVEQDVLSEFIEDECILKANVSIAKAQLNKAYTDWCITSNQTALNTREFRAKLIERGITEGRNPTGNVRIWKGIALKGRELAEQPKLTPSDNSDKTDGHSPEKTAILSHEEVIPENSVRNVSFVRTDYARTIDEPQANGSNIDDEYPLYGCDTCGSDDWHFNDSMQYECSNGHIFKKRIG